MNEITIRMTDADFERLTDSSTQWAGHPGWAGQADRFETVDSASATPSWDWKMCYHLGETWANVILARAYIEAAGYTYEIIWDMAGQDGENLSYVLLTDYVTPTWHRTGLI